MSAQRLGAAQSTVEALLFDVRDRGEVALRDLANHRRIAELSPGQVEEVVSRLLRLCPAAPAGVAADIVADLARLARRTAE